MGRFLRGALIEYGSDFLAPISNIVVFQFNPESLTRSIQVPARNTTVTARETSQVGQPPVEGVTLSAAFSASDALNDNNDLARQSAVGPHLAALEKMVYPPSTNSGFIDPPIDSIGDAIAGAPGR